jgi:protein NrfD
MDPFVADPEWGWWITLYFFLGGIASGAYFVATLIEMFGHEEDRPLARLGYRIAFPLISVCGIFLTVDLYRPERFWHMMFQSEVVHAALPEGWPAGGWGTMVRAPILKWWSPMSIGAWALALFGAWSFVSFVASFRSNMLGRRWFTHLFHVVGCGVGFFVASYTGVLLNATNQPLWSLSDWIAPLFLTSATSTALAVLLLLGRGIGPATRARLERADLWALGLELGLFLIFLASLGSLLPLVLTTWQGWALVGGTLSAGLLIPLLLHFGTDQGAVLAAWFALLGGFLLRFGIINVAPALLHLPAERSLESLNRSLPSTWPGQGLLVLTIVLAFAIPALLRKQWGLKAGSTALACFASVLVTAGVFCYSFGFSLGAKEWGLSPEEARERGGGVGASFFNRPEVIKPRTKIVKDAEP